MGNRREAEKETTAPSLPCFTRRSLLHTQMNERGEKGMGFSQTATSQERVTSRNPIRTEGRCGCENVNGGDLRIRIAEAKLLLQKRLGWKEAQILAVAVAR